MSFKKILIATLLLILLPFTLKVQGDDFGQGNSLFSDIKANKVGDILTVNIYEKTGQSAVEGGPGMSFLDFIPLFGASMKDKNTFDDKVKTCAIVIFGPGCR